MPTTTLVLNPKASDASTRRALTNLSLAVAKSKKIIVVTGAGISCSSGIPDFRSSDGLYALVKRKYPDVVLKGRDLFDASLFRDPTSTSVFYTFISELKRAIDNASPSPTHHFIKTLDTKRKLLRSYTQNIDGLEERAGLLGSSSPHTRAAGKGKGKLKGKEVRNVQLHGDIHRVRCTFCSADYLCGEDHVLMFNEGVAPDCPDCMERSKARVARSARALKVGTLRPAIVLYDEVHPLGDEIGAIQTKDIVKKPDMLIVMGTSMKVHGLKKLVKEFAKATHASSSSSSLSSSCSPKNGKQFSGKVIFVNKTPPGSEWDDIIDYHVSGDTDTWAEKVIEDWKKSKPSDWEVQQTLVSNDGEGSFKATKETEGVKPKGNKKKRKENLPPPFSAAGPIAAPPSEPVIVKPPSQTPPSSPSKRRQSSSHYSDIDCSPSKRRGVNAAISMMSLDERHLLFDATNSPMKVDEEIESRRGKPIDDISWIGSPMKVDDDADKRRKKGRVKAASVLDAIGSPMKVDGDGQKPRKVGSTRMEMSAWNQRRRKVGDNVDLFS